MDEMESVEQVGNLTLSRNVGEAVQAGEIRVEVVKIKGSTVLLRFTAPRSVRISRERKDEAHGSGD